MEADMKFDTGAENFAEVINKGSYYVDKTSYLKNIFMSMDDDKNLLLLRPRRFGKTLTMSMIYEFCRFNYKNPEDSSYQQKLFVDNGRNLAVAGDDYKELRDKFMGQLPVIFISFKNIEGRCYTEALSRFMGIVANVYKDFLFLSVSPKQDEYDKKQFLDTYEFTKRAGVNASFARDNAEDAASIASSFIENLASMLYTETGHQVLVMVDEYDVPMQKATVAKEPYYDDMLQIIKNISGSVFKQQQRDPWLYKGIITGCLKIAHQSVFTDANNFVVYDMDTEPYTGFLGFTKEETKKVLEDCELTDRERDVKEWYDGYLFGDKHVFCPWSVINFCKQACREGQHDITPEPYWINTRGNDLITLFTQGSMKIRDAGNIDKLQRLIGDDREENILPITLQEFTTYPDLSGRRVSFDTFMTMMLHTGYVTFAEGSKFSGEVNLRIPNREIRECFKNKISQFFSEENDEWFDNSLKLLQALMTNNVEEAKKLIDDLLLTFISVKNSGYESYYHGFLLGILGPAAKARNIEINSEQETGEGFSDITLSDGNGTAVIIELKKADTKNRADRLQASKNAAGQIIKSKYKQKFLELGCDVIYGLGIGFGGKNCEIETLGDLAAG